ncbi:MAG TPA: hypothetical protein VHA78_02775 [Candidatus Peribacteraceae bacterium]|nr:hypothetical protein [Candidatus Peribacteraceae bacterium]
MVQKSAIGKHPYFGPLIIFALLSFWWFYLKSLDIDTSRDARQLWGAVYQILAFYGAIAGTYISYKWGGHKSVLGRAVLAFSMGLFLQCFGQTYSSYYVYHYKVESPSYPGIGDIGFFGSVIVYIYGVALLSKISGTRISLRELRYKIWAFLIPTIILATSYALFLRGYEFDFSNVTKIFLDFGYPLGQAIYVSIAIWVLVASRGVLGGIMKKPILFLIAALIFQYFSDFTFLYEANAGTWYVGGINDYMYQTSYLLMTVSLLYLGSIFRKIRES